MALPSLVTRTPLDNFSIRYGNDQKSYIAFDVFTPVVVPKKTGSFYVYSKDNLRDEILDAPSGTEAPSVEWTGFTKTFTCEEKAVKQAVLGKDVRDFDRPVADLRNEAAMGNMDRLLINIERAAYTKVSTTGNYPSPLVTTLTDDSNRWSDDGGDPYKNVMDTKQAVYDSCGKYPNAMALSAKGLLKLLGNASIIERFKHTGAIVTTEQIKALFGLDFLHISGAAYNSAAEGATDSMGAIWGDECLLYVKDPSQRLRTMCYGRAFIANTFYTLSIQKPELGRGLGAEELETGIEYALESAAVASSSDDDFIAGGLIDNIF